MFNLSDVFQLKLVYSQFLVIVYFDEVLFECEIEIFFKKGFCYVGYELMVFEVGDYFVLLFEKEGCVLVCNQMNQIELLLNVCCYWQVIMFNGCGYMQNIVCLLYCWMYDFEGELFGVLYFFDKLCLNFGKSLLQNWQGLLFEVEGCNVVCDFVNFGMKYYFDFFEYQFDYVEVYECDYNWKMFIEVYFEDYYVVLFYLGFGSFVLCDDFKWEFGDWYSVQMVGVYNVFVKLGSVIYQKWYEQVLKFCNGVLLEFGVIWMVYYLGLMIEWYLYVLVVLWLILCGLQKMINIVEFYYFEEIVLFECEFVEVECVVYMEMVVEDDEIVMWMDVGCCVLMVCGELQVGLYQSLMEDGMQYFYEFLCCYFGDF